VYWKPVWHVLEGHATLVLANAMHIRNIPGRKSDKNDATWISDLLALGLIRSSFVPPAHPGPARPHPHAEAVGARDRAPHAPPAKEGRLEVIAASEGEVIDPDGRPMALARLVGRAPGAP
jgi:hypothetical protein